MKIIVKGRSTQLPVSNDQRLMFQHDLVELAVRDFGFLLQWPLSLEMRFVSFGEFANIIEKNYDV